MFEKLFFTPFQLPEFSVKEIIFLLFSSLSLNIDFCDLYYTYSKLFMQHFYLLSGDRNITLIEGYAAPSTRYAGAVRKLNLIVDIQTKMMQ